MAVTLFCDTVNLTNGAEFYVGGARRVENRPVEIRFSDQFGVLLATWVNGDEARRMAEMLCQVAHTYDPDTAP